MIYGDFTTGELYNNGNRILTSTNYGPLTVNDKCYVDAAISGNLAFGVQTPIVYSTVYKDTHNALNTSTGIFIAPFTGYYTLTGSLNTVTTGLEADITVDGTLKYTAFGSLTTRRIWCTNSTNSILNNRSTATLESCWSSRSNW